MGCRVTTMITRFGCSVARVVLRLTGTRTGGENYRVAGMITIPNMFSVPLMVGGLLGSKGCSTLMALNTMVRNTASRSRVMTRRTSHGVTSLTLRCSAPITLNVANPKVAELSTREHIGGTGDTIRTTVGVYSELDRLSR